MRNSERRSQRSHAPPDPAQPNQPYCAFAQQTAHRPFPAAGAQLREVVDEIVARSTADRRFQLLVLGALTPLWPRRLYAVAAATATRPNRALDWCAMHLLEAVDPSLLTDTLGASDWTLFPVRQQQRVVAIVLLRFDSAVTSAQHLGSFIVLDETGAIVMETFSFRTAIVESNHVRGNVSWVNFVRRAKAPELPVVLLEDAGALLGLIFALFGVVLTVTTLPLWGLLVVLSLFALGLAVGATVGALVAERAGSPMYRRQEELLTSFLDRVRADAAAVPGPHPA